MGLILGLLIGGGIGALIARLQEQRESQPSEAGQAHPVVDRIKHQFEEARGAAREAQAEKEAEMERMFDDLVHGEHESGRA
jgi:uncharacterized membrane-anchored protein YhcB (DUF1043 family)